MKNGDAEKVVGDVLLRLSPLMFQMDERDAPDIATTFLQDARAKGYAIVPVGEIEVLRKALQGVVEALAEWTTRALRPLQPMEAAAIRLGTARR